MWRPSGFRWGLGTETLPESKLWFSMVQVFLHQFGVADDVLVFWQHVILKYAVDVLEGVLKEPEVRHAVLAVFLSDYDWVMFRW